MRFWLWLLVGIILCPTWAQDSFVLNAIDPAGGYLVFMRKGQAGKMLRYRASTEQIATATEQDIGSSWQLYLADGKVTSLVPQGKASGVHECADMIRGFIRAVDERRFNAAYACYGGDHRRSQSVELCKADWDVRYLSPETGHLIFRGYDKDRQLVIQVFSTTTEANLSAARCARSFRGFKYGKVITFLCKREGSDFKIQSWQETDAKKKL